MRISPLSSTRPEVIVRFIEQHPQHPAPDLVERDFTADAPNKLWVADATRILPVRACSGWPRSGTRSPAPAPLAARVHRAWVDFVTIGTPGWPEYRPDRRTTQLIDDEWAVVDDPFAAERDAWTHTRTGNTPT
ncbi:hypothetical protein [Nocardia amamiensis]|uniref:hypothetical protein n=1 Tax=Nocardia amamiensis TaxID=404578 RepID=UPI0012F4D246|nr:hypothetical protein [Nocardia amamiensis]